MNRQMRRKTQRRQVKLSDLDVMRALDLLYFAETVIEMHGEEPPEGYTKEQLNATADALTAREALASLRIGV